MTSEDSEASSLTRRQALTGIAAIGAGGTAAGAGTYAAFSDTATESDGLDAGTLNLTTGATSSLSFTTNDIKPGDTGGDSADISPGGSLTGDLTVSGALTGAAGKDGVADLGKYLEFEMWLDAPSTADGSYESGDIGLLSDGTTGSPAYATVASYDGTTWTDVITGMSSDWEFYVDWQLPSGTPNEAQGDGVTVDFDFTLNQQ